MVFWWLLTLYVKMKYLRKREKSKKKKSAKKNANIWKLYKRREICKVGC